MQKSSKQILVEHYVINTKFNLTVIGHSFTHLTARGIWHVINYHIPKNRKINSIFSKNIHYTYSFGTSLMRYSHIQKVMENFMKREMTLHQSRRSVDVYFVLSSVCLLYSPIKKQYYLKKNPLFLKLRGEVTLTESSFWICKIYDNSNPGKTFFCHYIIKKF